MTDRAWDWEEDKGAVDGPTGVLDGAGDPAWHPVLCTHFKLDFGQPFRLPRRLFYETVMPNHAVIMRYEFISNDDRGSLFCLSL